MSVRPLHAPLVLLIEDEPAHRRLFTRILEPAGYQVAFAAPPIDPHTIGRLRPAFIVLDMHLGGGASGITILERLRATPGTRSIPVLVCSADHPMLGREADRLRRLEAEVLKKPFRITELTEHIGALLSRPMPTMDIGVLDASTVSAN